jgi:hypothetical protein
MHFSACIIRLHMRNILHRRTAPGISLAVAAGRQAMPSLSKINQRSVKNARQHLKLGNAGAYARSVSAAIRCASSVGQVRALWAAVDSDDMGRWLVGPVDCPVARDEQVAA